MRLRLLWVALIGLHVIGAIYAWRMLPHGFPVGHPRFWINQVLPVALIAAGVSCIAAMWRSRPRTGAALICAFIALHAGMAIGWIAVFPTTGARPALIGAFLTAVLSACAFAPVRGAAGRTWIAGAVLGLVAGFAVPWAQRGRDPATHPAEPPRALRAAGPAGELPPWAQAFPEVGAVQLAFGDVHVDLDPMLRFISRSPDRGWTVFARPRLDREPSRLTASAADNVVHVEAETVLEDAVYSHLNSFTTLRIRGHHRLYLEFSAAPGQRIEVMYSEYPTGRPSRFAYLDGSELHVVEAESGEKGPFTELAHGPLAAGGVLGITLFDEQRPIARIDLRDFAAQASTQVSPTAGWGVPENAIEFSLGRDRPDAEAYVFITLAGTSVGRGWDSVGHAPGVYRNRIDVRALTASAE